ncbi:MAG: hypothetical protein ACOY82_17410 [Pseudomonadota bacterium]
MPSNTIYKVLVAFSVALGIGGVVIAAIFEFYGQTVAATIAATFSGAALGLSANIFVQKIASNEQTDLMRAITLEAEGIQPLPSSFFNLKSIAHATKKAADSSSKEVVWICTELTKIGGSGSRFVTYSNVTKNLLGEPVTYHVTFIGSEGCVICVITNEHETSSVVTLETRLSSAGIYFGTAFLTDWSGERDLTLMLVTDKVIHGNDLRNLPKSATAAFHKWYETIDPDIEAAYKAFPKV